MTIRVENRAAVGARTAYVRSATSNVSFANASWVDLTSDMDLVIRAAVGDIVELEINGTIASEANTLFLDVVTIVGGSAVNSVGQGAAGGLPSASHQGVAGW